MDPNRDNPFIRFATFWWGLGAFLIFAVVLTVVLLSFRKKGTALEEVAAAKRYETKTKVGEAQATALSKQAIEAAIPNVAKQLAASKPTATVAAPPAAAAAEPIDPAVMALGKTQYITCMACHGQNGEGGPIAPPLAGSDWVAGPVENLIRIQLRGLQGPITVSGKEYTFPVGMAPLSYQTDEQIAAVLTFVRNSFGNQASAVKPEQVKALRGEVGKPMLTVKDLIQP